MSEQSGDGWHLLARIESQLTHCLIRYRFIVPGCLLHQVRVTLWQILHALTLSNAHAMISTLYNSTLELRRDYGPPSTAFNKHRTRYQRTGSLTSVTARASFRLVSMIGQGSFNLHVSVPLVLEYEDVLHRHLPNFAGLNVDDIDRFLDYLCAVAHQHELFFLWRPTLRDPRDETLLELAIVAECDVIVTYNQRDFAGTRQFDIRALTPREYLVAKGVIK